MRVPGLDAARTSWRRSGARGVRTAKTVLACVVAYLLASRLTGVRPPLLAPLTALLVVQVTLYESLTAGLRRVVAVLAGVLVAVALTSQVRLTWWSLALVVGLGLALGRLLRLRDSLLEVPISGMLILGVGASSRAAAFDRVSETLLGAAVGMLVHVLVAPPLYVRPAGDAVRAVGRQEAELLATAAQRLRAEEPPTRSDAQGWLSRARDIDRAVGGADRAVSQAASSLRLNPRTVLGLDAGEGRPAGLGRPAVLGGERADVPLRTALDSLEHVAVCLRGSFRALVEVTGEDGASPYREPDRQALADLLAALAGVVRAYGAMATAEVDTRTGRARLSSDTTGEQPALPPEDAALRDRLDDARSARARFASLVGTRERLLGPDPSAEPGEEWVLHGELLANLDRLLAELDVARRRAWRRSLRRDPRSAGPPRGFPLRGTARR